jgi:3'-5' exoribonuclease
MGQALNALTGSSPGFYRLLNLSRLPAKDGQGIHNEAYLYHDDHAVIVSWHSSTVDSRLHYGCLVAVRGMPRNPHRRQQEPVPIAGLILLDKPLAAPNLFHTIPPTWVRERATVAAAARLWEDLSRPFQHLLNAVLWEGGRFQRFVTGPASLSEPCRGPGGNFRQAVAAATEARQLMQGMPDVSTPVVIMAAMLTAIGKADDFRFKDRRYVLTERGYWVGGPTTILEWLAVARSKVIVPEAQYLALVHALVAARGQAEDRRSMEATVLAVATRLTQEPGMLDTRFPKGD